MSGKKLGNVDIKKTRNFTIKKISTDSYFIVKYITKMHVFINVKLIPM
jgi:hypothetical protein